MFFMPNGQPVAGNNKKTTYPLRYIMVRLDTRHTKKEHGDSPFWNQNQSSCRCWIQDENCRFQNKTDELIIQQQKKKKPFWHTSQRLLTVQSPSMQLDLANMQMYLEIRYPLNIYLLGISASNRTTCHLIWCRLKFNYNILIDGTGFQCIVVVVVGCRILSESLSSTYKSRNIFSPRNKKKKSTKWIIPRIDF